jgi:hypothetical protein
MNKSKKGRQWIPLKERDTIEMVLSLIKNTRYVCIKKNCYAQVSIEDPEKTHCFRCYWRHKINAEKQELLKILYNPQFNASDPNKFISVFKNYETAFIDQCFLYKSQNMQDIYIRLDASYITSKDAPVFSLKPFIIEKRNRKKYYNEVDDKHIIKVTLHDFIKNCIPIGVPFIEKLSLINFYFDDDEYTTYVKLC